jgi:hypothetical protein
VTVALTLDELCRLAHHGSSGGVPRGGVPDWALGCFRRRSITYFTGATDTSTCVYWLQTRGLTADLRLPAGPPDARSLAAVEGGLASARWDGDRMVWSDWTSFQLHDRWPEPGILRRVGDCLIEHAPSGAYVEDWRVQPSPPGPLLGLRLIEERDADRGEVLHRGGGLVVCGRHAALVRGRPHPLPPGCALADIVGAGVQDRALARAALACEASYGTRAPDAGDFVVKASTDPEREGSALLALDGFTLDAVSGRVVQRAREDGRALERLFMLETAEFGFGFPIDTPATAEARGWLERESSTLLAAAVSPK